MIKAIVFDFDGVLAESANLKTRAFSDLFKGEDEETVRQIVAYHLKNAGVSRFEKFKIIYMALCLVSFIKKMVARQFHFQLVY